MHFHTSPAGATRDALAGAQAAQSELVLRRARELREAAARLKAHSSDIFADVSPDVATLAGADPQSLAQTVGWVNAWQGQSSSQSSAQSQVQGLSQSQGSSIQPVSGSAPLPVDHLSVYATPATQQPRGETLNQLHEDALPLAFSTTRSDVSSTVNPNSNPDGGFAKQQNTDSVSFWA